MWLASTTTHLKGPNASSTRSFFLGFKKIGIQESALFFCITSFNGLGADVTCSEIDTASHFDGALTNGVQ